MNQIEDMEKEVKDLETQAQSLYGSAEALRAKLFQAKIEEVFNSGALKEALWKVESDLSGRTRKQCFTLYGRDEKFKKLTDLIQTNYHCSTELADKVQIYFDDWDIRIVFECEKQAIAFIKKHGLPLDLEKIKNKRDEHKKAYEGLNKFLRKFKKIGG